MPFFNSGTVKKDNQQPLLSSSSTSAPLASQNIHGTVSGNVDDSYRYGAQQSSYNNPPSHNPYAQGLESKTLPYGPGSKDSTHGAPPSYSDVEKQKSVGAPHRIEAEDEGALLAKYDTVILIDDSASVRDLWPKVTECVVSFVDMVGQHDDDGVDLRTMNNKLSLSNLRDASGLGAQLKKVRPLGMTPTHKHLGDILQNYIADYKKDKGKKPLNLICITDGLPDNKAAVKACILKAAQELDGLDAPENQVGIQFCLIGDAAKDPDVQKFYNNLDDDLQSEHNLKRDMVDVTVINSDEGDMFEQFTKVTVGALDDRWDASGSAS